MESKYVLKPALPSDAEEIANIMHLTLPLMPRTSLEYRHVSKPAYLAYSIASKRSDLSICAANPEDLCALKAVLVNNENEEEIVGYAIWGWTNRAEHLISSSRAAPSYPQHGNAALHTTFYSLLRAMEDAHKPLVPHYMLFTLSTSPLYQRRGIGARLVSYGLSRASASDVPVYLSASPMGRPLYAKLGFRELGRMEIDLGLYGWEGSEEERVHVHVAMIKGSETGLTDRSEEGRK